MRNLRLPNLLKSSMALPVVLAFLMMPVLLTAQLSVAVSTNQSSCIGSIGSAVATPSGNVGAPTYQWDNLDDANPVISTGTTGTLSNIPAGNYSVTVTDGAVTTTSTFVITCSVACGNYNESLEADCSNTLLPSSFGGNDNIHELVFKDGITMLSPPNVLTASEINKTLTFEINLISTGANVCWGTINVEDKTGPDLICPNDTIIECSQSIEILSAVTASNPLSNATATDCSAFGDITHFDEVRNLDCGANALSEDGTVAFVNLTGLEDFEKDGFTFEAWINPFANDGVIFQADSITVGLNTALNVFVATGDSTMTSATTVNLTEWTHIAVTGNATRLLSIYIDGVKVTSSTTLGGCPTTAPNPGFLFRDQSAKSNFDGILDDVRVFTSPRSDAEIFQNFDRELSGSETDLIAYYTMNQGVANGNNAGLTQLIDDSGNNNTGTLQNFSLTGSINNWTENRFQSNRYSQVIKRTFVVTDVWGNSSQCMQFIQRKRADIADVTFPSNFTESCKNATSTEPDVTGYPQHDPDGAAGPIPPIDIVPGETGGACMLIATKSDDVYDKCGPDLLIKRTWIVINMCQDSGIANVMTMMEQIITISTPAPELNTLPAIRISADQGRAGDHYGCSSTAMLDSATVMDLCDNQFVRPEDIVITIPGVGQITNGGKIPSPGLAIRTEPYVITYTVTDTCGKSSSMDVMVTVIDSLPPQCNTINQNFTLPEAGTASIPADAFDGSSYDNCNPQVWISARRLVSECTGSGVDDFGDVVEFCCDDVPNGVEEVVMVQQLVCDKDPDLDSNYRSGAVNKETDGTPVVSDFLGNCSKCMAAATVKPPVEGTLTCPSDTTLTCDQYDSASNYGQPVISGGCTNGLMTTFTNENGIDCTLATNIIIRRHRLFNGAGEVIDSCDQRITVTGGIMITPPASREIDCGLLSCDSRPDTLDTDRPTVLGGDCVSSTILFNFVEDCAVTSDGFVITRTWTVSAPADLATCFAGQSFVQTITAPNCCVDPTDGISVSGDLITLDVKDPPIDITNYNVKWFTGGTFVPGPPISFTGGTEVATAEDLVSFNSTFVGQFHTAITQNNNDECLFFEGVVRTSPRIIGLVSTPSGSPVANVTVALESNQEASSTGKDEIMESALTSTEGIYEFEEVEVDQVSRLSLSKDGDDRTDVSTLDLLRLARHILGIRQITSPYGYIAADMTGNGKITTGDMLLLQKMILGVTSELPDNSSWRFVQEDHVFDDMNKVLDYSFPETFEFSGEETEEDLENINFIAIKVGDLADAYGVQLQGGNSTNKTLSLQTDDMALLPGALIEIPITSAALNNLYGYQHAYQFDVSKLAFTGIKYGDEITLTDNNFGFSQLAEGQLTTSWFDTDAQDVEEGTVLYTLRFEVRQAGQLRDALSISSTSTSAESYFEDDKIGGVQLNFAAPTNQLTIVNTPNPFNEETQIRFDAPQKGEAVITISDISGREVYRTTTNAVQGENQRTFSKTELQEAGIYILRINLNGSSAAQKMIMIE